MQFGICGRLFVSILAFHSFSLLHQVAVLHFCLSILLLGGTVMHHIHIHSVSCRLVLVSRILGSDFHVLRIPNPHEPVGTSTCAHACVSSFRHVLECAMVAAFPLRSTDREGVDPFTTFSCSSPPPIDVTCARSMRSTCEWRVEASIASAMAAPHPSGRTERQTNGYRYGCGGTTRGTWCGTSVEDVFTFSCWPPSWHDLCGCERWSSCAGREGEGWPRGDGRGSSRCLSNA